MKKLILLVFCAFFMLAPLQQASANVQVDLNDFYNHLTNGIKYPEKARKANLQGNSLILFTVANGKLSSTSVHTELGSGFDVEVLNQILAYDKYKALKNGKYALKATFKLEGSEANIINQDISIPDSYYELKITIVAFPEPVIVNSDRYKDFTVQWRGVNNASANSPKVIVDDEEIEYDNLKTINPKDINSIEILKDVSAISRYGISASNGVIVITTKNVPSQSKKDSSPVKNEN